MALFSKGKKKTRSRRKRKETKAEALLRQRGSETVGFALLLVGVVLVLCFATYSPEDPSFFVKTDAEASNLLGVFGSYLADTVHLVLGASFWSIPLILLLWGLRLMLHWGGGRAIPRLLFAPIAIFLVALFFSTHESSAVTGMGGILGDEALGFILGQIPMDLSLSLKTISIVLAVLSLVAMLFVLGVNRAEARFIWQYLLAGFVLLYLGVKAVLAKLSVLGVRGAKVGAVAAGQGLNAAGETGLRAAKTAAERLKEQREAAKAEKQEKGVQLAERLSHLHNRMADEVQTDAAQPIATDIVPAPKNSEIIDQISPDTGAEYPALGGVSRNLPPAEEEADYGWQPPKEPKVKHPDPRPKPKSRRAKAEEQPKLALEPLNDEGYQAPPLSLLSSPVAITREHLSDDALTENAKMLETVLDDYGIRGEIIGVRPGPVVTMYELEPAAGVKASRVIGLADDIARSMSALAARVSTVPGRSIIGIELPNDHRETVYLREIFSSKAFGDSKHQLPMALGKDIGGDPVVVNLARMPHLLIAGTTGSGKSVGINTMILSLIYALSPEDCRLIMIDPKMLELSVYDGIPHLLSPVVTDPKKAVVALKWAVAEMEERYRKMSKLNVRNIDGFNGRVADALKKGEAFTRTVQTGFDDATGEPVFETEEYELEKMPYIVVIVDEMADLMMVAGKEIEACIQRLAQMARAAGIHLIMATQRPSVDVITGTIKANFPTRISFQVTSKIDSRTVLGEMGAEQLLGKGDMLYMGSGGRMVRVHGPFVSDEEVEEIVSFVKSQGEPEYISSISEGPKGEEAAEIDLVLGLGSAEATQNALLDQAIAIATRDRKCSISYIQRKLSIGYNKAAKLVEEMEDMGVVSPANHVGKREVLVPERPDDYGK